MMTNEQREKPIVTTERKTLEMCGDELRPGVRCVLTQGHSELHECHRVNWPVPVRWK